MIYLDALSGEDQDHCPAERPTPCLNCGQVWEEHAGWGCPEVAGHHLFSQLKDNERYLTQSMKSSISHIDTRKEQHLAAVKSVIPVAIPAKLDMSDWRNWRHNRAGECDCGIAQSQCIYHKERSY